MRKLTFLIFFLVSFGAFAKQATCLSEMGIPVSERAYADAKRLKLPNELMDSIIEEATTVFDKRDAFAPDEVMVFGYRLKMKTDAAGKGVVDRILQADL